MACCLTAPSHYPNQCWLIITKVQGYSAEGNFPRDTLPSITTISLKITFPKFHAHLSGANELKNHPNGRRYCTNLYFVTRFIHDDVIKWKHFPRYWPFVRRIHRSPVNSPQKGQWRGVLMFSLICAWINGWASNREAGDLRRLRAHYDANVMWSCY